MDVFVCVSILALIPLSAQTPLALSQGNVNLDSALASRVTDFKLNLHRLLEGSRIRRKRNIQNPVESEDYQMRVGGSEALDLPYLSDYNLTFWIPVKHRYHNHVLIGTQEGYLMLFELSEVDDKIGKAVAVSLKEEVTRKAMAFSHLDEQWFAVLQPSSNSTWIRFYLRVGRGLERRQSINLEGESDFDLVTVKNVLYLAVITHGNSVVQPGFVLYHWTETQFDEIARRDVYGARSIACWILDGSLYFAVAQEYNEEGNFAVGSPIFLFNSKDESELVLLQKLATYGPKKVLHFFVSGSNYVIVIGRRDAAIYWWANDQFLLWQTITGTALASDVSTLALENGEVVIVIALKEEVLFLTLDDSGHYIVSFTMKFAGFHLRSLQFMYSGEAYYALALFAASLKPHPHPIYKLILRPYYIPSGSSLDTLHQCLKDVSDMLDERQAEINNVHLDLNRVWLRDGNQTITTEVIVTGETSSVKTSTITEVIVVVDNKILPDSSLSEVEKSITGIKSIVEGVQQNVKQSVLKSVKQDIEGLKHFQETLSIPSLNMESTNVDISVNGVPISMVHQYALRRLGDQTFSYPLTITNMYSEWITANTLNGVKLDDFLMLEGQQDITGHLTFSNLYTKDLLVSNINTIPVDNFVTVYSDQIVKDLKSISFLESSTIDVSGQVNGENLTALYNNIVTLAGDHKINARMVFNSTIHIKGDFFLNGLINGEVSIDQLATKTVTISTDQELKGPFVFTSTLGINQDLKLSSVNGVNISNLVTLSTDQTIRGPLTFSSLQINRDLVVNLLNGFKLHENAVLKTNDPQFVDGYVTFTQPLTVDFIDMSEHVTLDGVDPSLLVQDIIKHVEGIVKHNSSVFRNVVVSGNITATDGVNGYAVSDLSSLVWLKTTPQVVDVPIHITRMSLNNNMEVKEVNKLDLKTDFVHTSRDEIIISTKVFQHNVAMVTHIDVDAGTLINGFDVVTFVDEMDNFVDEGTIRGKKVLQNLEIHGDIHAYDLNGLQIDNLMRPKVFQEVTAQVEFPSTLTIVNGNLKSNTVDFRKFNSIDLHEYISKAVSRTNPHSVIQNKDFTNLGARHLSMLPGSTLDRTSFNDMVNRVVTLHTSQEIPSQKNFLDNVFFRNPLTAHGINGQDPSSLLGVVLVDEKSRVSAPKTFTGTVQAQEASVGLVNGIDISLLNQSAFFRSEHNEVKPLMAFIGDIKVGNLVTGSFVDGIKWDDLIFLNRDEKLGPVVLPDAAIFSNLWVTGLVNGCDLTELGERALYTNKEHQRIQEEVIIESIQVIGNLNLEDVVNQVPMEDLQSKLITLTGDQIITSNVELGGGWKVANMALNNLVNGANLSFVMRDAVKHSVAQDIWGHKHFYDLKTTPLTAGKLFVRDELDGVHIDNLYNNAVLKFGQQVIDGEKTFSSITTDVAVIQGYINGLRVPHDVVLTSTTEHISSPLSFMSDLVLLSQLDVQGNVDDVNLDSLLQNLVTLGGNEIVSSHLSFNKDVVVNGKLNVDGTINDIVLEMVAKITNSSSLEGYKTFTEDILVTGSMVSPTINGYDIKDLDRIILKKDEDDFLKEVQIFKKPLTAQNLIAETVNGVSIPDLPMNFSTVSKNIDGTLHFFGDFSSISTTQLSRQLQAVENQISRFGYFILFQEINLGSAVKILNAYRIESPSSEFSHSMVAWTSQKLCSHMEMCCYTEFSQWLRVKRSGHLVIESDLEEGRFYPLHNPAPVMVDKDFVVWSNGTRDQPKWCAKQEEMMYIAAYSQLGYLEQLLNIRNAPILSDIKTFTERHLYAVAGFYYNKKEDDYGSTVLYAFNEVKREWNEHQILPSYGALSLDLTYFSHDGIRELLLAVGTGIGFHSSVYKWHDDENEFYIIQNIASRFVTSTLWVKQGSNQLLVMANVEQWPRKGENCADLVSGGEVNVYSYEGNVKWIQSIPVKGVVSLVSFTLTGDTFLVAASRQLQTIFIYEWKGYAGFTQIQSMFVGEVRHLSSYTLDDELYLTVAIETGPSKVLKVAIRGNRNQINLARKDPIYPDHQRDEAKNEETLNPGC